MHAATGAMQLSQSLERCSWQISSNFVDHVKHAVCSEFDVNDANGLKVPLHSYIMSFITGRAHMRGALTERKHTMTLSWHACCAAGA